MLAHLKIKGRTSKVFGPGYVSWYIQNAYITGVTTTDGNVKKDLESAKQDSQYTLIRGILILLQNLR